MINNSDRDGRIAIFDDTIRLCRNHPKLIDAIKNSISQQIVYRESKAIPAPSSHSFDKTKVVVTSKRTFEAASAYLGKKVCVLNFASATNPGGGVTRGSNAQEECLCRCSTLYPCISDRTARSNFHDAHRIALLQNNLSPLYNDDCIYTPDIVIFKTDTGTPELMSESKWYSVDVITCAAPNLREKPSNQMNPNSGLTRAIISPEALQDLHYRRANRILDIAKKHGAEILILGAFGCGAFQNPPNIVASGIHKAIKEHDGDFETIEFAIYCSPRDTGNYEAFKKVFSDR